MIKSLKKSLAIFMAVILLLPMVVKLEHHHDHFVCHAHNEKHFHDHHGNCPVCSFEFSVFSINNVELTDERIQHSGVYLTPFCKTLFHNHFNYSFLLRAPPVDTGSILSV